LILRGFRGFKGGAFLFETNMWPEESFGRDLLLEESLAAMMSSAVMNVRTIGRNPY
jgi:hypothetical protein